MSLELQRFWSVSKNDQVKLRATLGGGVPRARGSEPFGEQFSVQSDPAPGPGSWGQTAQSQLEPSQRVTASSSALFRQSQFSSAT